MNKNLQRKLAWESYSSLVTSGFLKQRKYKKINAKLERVVVAGLLGIIYGLMFNLFNLI